MRIFISLVLLFLLSLLLLPFLIKGSCPFPIVSLSILPFLLLKKPSYSVIFVSLIMDMLLCYPLFIHTETSLLSLLFKEFIDANLSLREGFSYDIPLSAMVIVLFYAVSRFNGITYCASSLIGTFVLSQIIIMEA